MVLGYTYYHLTGKEEDREKGRFYLFSLTFFHVGAVLAVLGCLRFGLVAGLFGIIIVVVAEIVSIEREVKQKI